MLASRAERSDYPGRSSFSMCQWFAGGYRNAEPRSPRNGEAIRGERRHGRGPVNRTGRQFLQQASRSSVSDPHGPYRRHNLCPALDTLGCAPNAPRSSNGLAGLSSSSELRFFFSPSFIQRLHNRDVIT